MTPLDRSSFDRAIQTAPGWTEPARRAAMGLVEKLDMPTSKEEVWRYVDLDFHITDFGIPEGPGEPLETDDVLGKALGETAADLHIVDGAVVAADRGAGPVVVTPLGRALADPAPQLVERFGAGIAADLDIFSAAHHAFVGDGGFVHVPRGAVIDRPVYVEIQATTPGTVSFPHLTIVAEESSQVSVVINYRSPSQRSLLVVPQVEAFASANARIDLTIVQNWGYDTAAIAQARLVAERDATVRLAEAGLGGRLSRLHLFVDLLGRGSNADVIGAYFGEEEQVLDYRYFMHHAGLNTTSNMFLKGAVEDEALSVFTGMIRIDEGAQRTDAFQTNRNLILSEGAAAQSVPNLEILANDVRCGHGSTVGPLDEEQRYYLMSRGLPRERADRLQLRGFFEEVIGRFSSDEVAGPVRSWINEKFIAAQEEGRV